MRRYEIIEDVSSQTLQRFDMIIDARSPAEFAEDHLPGAVSLPVLDDEERAAVGTIYTQDSPFKARRMGAALVSANIAAHLQSALADQPKSFRPLVYCWRGGMRSNAFATVLSAVGWPVALLEGGYRRWRRAVTEGLEEAAQRFSLILIDGQTGTGKTALLHRLAEKGAQTLDLEGLAAHRGSIFGDFSGAPQPSQKAFESGIWTQIRDFSAERPVYVEAESSLVGKRRVPGPVWAKMKTAPRIEIAAPARARAEFLLCAYADLVADRAKIEAALDGLARQHAKSDIEAWRELAGAGRDRDLAEALITGHYDPAYDRSRKRRPVAGLTRLQSESLESGALDALADQILEMEAERA